MSNFTGCGGLAVLFFSWDLQTLRLGSISSCEFPRPSPIRTVAVERVLKSSSCCSRLQGQREAAAPQRVCADTLPRGFPALCS